MASQYVSKGFFLSGTGFVDIYTCPVGKRAIVKQVAVQNETANNAYVTVVWKDFDAVAASVGTTLGAGTTIVQFTIVNSGAVVGHGRLHAIDDFLAISENDMVSCIANTGMRLSVLLSAVEQDLVLS